MSCHPTMAEEMGADLYRKVVDLVNDDTSTLDADEVIDAIDQLLGNLCPNCYKIWDYLVYNEEEE